MLLSWGIVFLIFVLFAGLFFFFLFFFGPFVDRCWLGDCRFPSWPVWSPRFSKLRLSKRGGLGQQPLPVVAPADGPASNTSSSSSGIGGSGGVGNIGSDGPEARLQSFNTGNHTSPLVRPHISWRPISPLAVGRPQPLGLTALKPPPSPSADVPLRSLIPPSATVAAAIPPPHESSLEHSRYS